jgi:hypothetical protein
MPSAELSRRVEAMAGAPRRPARLAGAIRAAQWPGVPEPSQRALQRDGLGNWTVRMWKPLRDKLGVSEPPYGLRHSYASLRIREGAWITELALNTYAHVIDELRGAPLLPAAQETIRARQAVAERGLDGGRKDALG